jgi:hypothetical protein
MTQEEMKQVTIEEALKMLAEMSDLLDQSASVIRTLRDASETLFAECVAWRAMHFTDVGDRMEPVLDAVRKTNASGLLSGSMAKGQGI